MDNFTKRLLMISGLLYGILMMWRNTTMKKLLSIILSMIMILAYIPVVAFADTEPGTGDDPVIEEPDGTHHNGVLEENRNPDTVYYASILYKDRTYYYESLKSAIQDATDGDTVKLERSFAIWESYYIYTDADITIDLAGHSITSSKYRVYIGFDGTETYDCDITLTDTVGGGRITASSSQAVIYVSNGKFTLDGGTINNSYDSEGEYAYGIYAKRSSEVVMSGGYIFAKVGIRGLPANISMSGGEIFASSVGVFVDGSENGRAKFTMTDGEINVIGDDNAAIYAHNFSDISVFGGSIYGRYGIQARETSKVEINGGTIEGTIGSLAITGNSKITLNEGILRNSVVIDGDGAGFVMNGGKVIGRWSEPAIVTVARDDDAKCNVTINAGEIAASDTALYLAQQGDVVIKGGSISGANGITMVSGNLDISPISDDDLSISSVGAPAADGNVSDNGNNAEGTAIAILGNSQFKNKPSVNICGGTFKSEYGMALWVYDKKGENNVKKINITGGNFIGGTWNQKQYAACASSADYCFIKGGQFNSDISKFVSLGYTVKENNKTFTVSNTITFTKETSDTFIDPSTGNTVTSVISEGKDGDGNAVIKTVKTTKTADGTLVGTVTSMKYTYDDISVTYVKSDKGNATATVEGTALSDQNKMADMIDKVMATSATDGNDSIHISLDISAIESKTYQVPEDILKKIDALSVDTQDGKLKLNSGAIDYILENLSDNAFTVSAESIKNIKDIIIKEAKASKVYLSSISRKDSKVTATWKKVEGVDGYTVKLITNGKTYIKDIPSADVESVTFTQDVTKSYRVKIATYTYVDDEKISSTYTYRTSVNKPVYSGASRNSRTGKITVKWKKAPGVGGYKVVLYTGGKTYTKYLKSTSSSVVFTPSSRKSYRVKLYAYSTIEGKKAYSVSTTKTYISKPVMTSLSKNKKTGKVTAKWNRLSSVTGYRIRLNANNTTYTKVITSNSKTSYTFSPKVKGDYTVSISAYSVFSGVRSYTEYRTYKVN